ncbi:MAG: N-acetylneuraminate synthase family protein, partial [Patescibacteria group bacterium]|nr:N-acetylneuraminate synthase family protein [Patescibacteria group bacterium]
MMRTGKREIGPGNPAYIIFEVASTHGNDWDTAEAYVAQAAEAGADAVKFQLFETDKLLTPITKGFKGTYEYFKKSETPRGWFPRLKALCDERGIDLLCTPFDTGAADFLEEVGVPAMKIASGDLTNPQILAHVARLKKPVILSTGMATLAEVARAVETLRESGAEDIALLQCVSVYPTSFEDANVSAIRTLHEKFGTAVGYSDNGSKGMLVPLLAIALGASIIEKHVTSKKERGDIDDVFSMSVEEFAEMARRIREVEKMDKTEALALLRKEFGADVDTALGDGVKRPAPHGTEKTQPGIEGTFIQREADERHWARRGVYLNRAVKKGEVIT